MTLKIRRANRTLDISGFVSAVLIAVYLVPIGRVSGYIPFYLMGLIFGSLLIFSHFTLIFESCFFIMTMYLVLSNLACSAFLYNSSLASAMKTSLFLFVPFMAMQSGALIAKKSPEYDFQRIALLLLVIEFAVGLLQSRRNSLGILLTSLYGSDKYLESYYISWARIRSIGTLGNPNSFAIGILGFALVVLFKEEKRSHRIIALFLSGASVIMSASRTALVLLMLVLFFRYGNVINNKTTLIKKIVNVLAFVILVLFLLYVYTIFVHRDLTSAALDSRRIIWANLIESIYRQNGRNTIFRFLFGNGVSYIKTLESTDNEYLFIFLSGGVVGVVIWAVSMIKTAVHAVKIQNYENRTIVFSILLIWLFAAVTAAFFTSSTLSYFMFLYSGYALYRDKREKQINVRGILE